MTDSNTNCLAGMLLQVRYFCGDMWPVSPVPSAVEVIRKGDYEDFGGEFEVDILFLSLEA